MKKWLIFILVFLLFLNFSFVSAVTISASDVKISVAGSSTTLQLAADGGYLKGLSSYASSTSISAGQHDASQIWVKTSSGEKTLLSALSSGVSGLCGSGSSLTYSSTNIPDPSHLATEIVFSSGETLQAKINAGTFCCTPKTCSNLGFTCGTPSDGCGGTLSCGTCTGTKYMKCSDSSGGTCVVSVVYTYRWVTGSWSGCPSSCGGSQDRSVNCMRRNDGTTVEDSYCPASTKPSPTLSCSCRWVMIRPNDACIWFPFGKPKRCYDTPSTCVFISGIIGSSCDTYNVLGTCSVNNKCGLVSCGFLGAGTFTSMMQCQNLAD